MNAAICCAGRGAAHAAPPAPADDWRFAKVSERDVARVQAFIHERFHAAYDADVRHFMPELLALHRGETLIAACGLRHAEAGPLFLETYLDGPVERILARRGAPDVARSDIVEVGNLSISRPGANRHLIAHLTSHLHALGIGWTVFTAMPALRNNFLRLGIPLHVLADADDTRLPAGERAAWGRYYDQQPLVCAVSVSDAYAALAS